MKGSIWCECRRGTRRGDLKTPVLGLGHLSCVSGVRPFPVFGLVPSQLLGWSPGRFLGRRPAQELFKSWFKS